MLNVVFMGTPDFAVPTLEKLCNDKNINVSLVITKQDKKANRGNILTESAVKKVAKKYNLPYAQPLKIKNDTDVINKIKSLNPDFIIVVAYGEILSKEILDIPKFASINGHASLLPKYRGASPIQSAILNGDKITGTTAMLMDEGLDTGDILVQKELTLDEKETSETLFDKLSYLTADTLLYAIKNFENIDRIKQEESIATKSIIIKKEYGLIDFENETNVEIDRKVRAYTPWPSAYININDVQYKIIDVSVIDDYDISIGTKITDNIYITKKEIIAKCKTGYLLINKLKKSGKNSLNAKDFINGLKL